MIRLRMEHPILRENTAPSGMGFPFMSFHGAKPWEQGFEWNTRLLGVLFAGKRGGTGDQVLSGRPDAPEGRENGDDLLYLAVNTYWESQSIELPKLPQGWCWRPLADTARGKDAVIRQKELLGDRRYLLNPRSVCVLAAEEIL